jgi:hypothetical protein
MMPQYKIIAKNSNEFSETDWTEFTSAFNTVFKKQFPVRHFKTKYFGSPLGYSVHSILFHNNQVVGMFTAIPRQYIYKEKEITIALGCDAFILKEHRKDEYFLKQMADEVIVILKNAGVNYYISIPNKTAYPYWKYYGGWKDIGRLSYYVLPLRVSGLLGKFKLLDPLTFFALKSIVSISTFIFPFSNRSVEKTIHLKRDQNFLAQRYPADYSIRNFSDKNYFVYRVYNEDNIRTAYLIECVPLSQVTIANAIKQIIKEMGREIDIIMFVGKIDNPPFFLFKVPVRMEPRIQPFIGLSTNSVLDNDFFSISSWDVGLADFDNR